MKSNEFEGRGTGRKKMREQLEMGRWNRGKGGGIMGCYRMNKMNSSSESGWRCVHVWMHAQS